MRKLQSRFNEINIADMTGREKMRSAPILTKEQLEKSWSTAPDHVEEVLLSEDEETD